MRSHAPDAAGPALRADDATFETRPSSGPPGTARGTHEVHGRSPALRAATAASSRVCAPNFRIADRR
ncbi:hypothetical protein EOT10_01805 [Streptomyces antnestii]|uniref:Uncharacterized protein n=1 Tax=Streptomyces antnestii TaxID=2494256 RepID=A0A3S2XYS1_9ACTN|nr:hypothetical protein EOT10_01805 [Streptomyces sp. San01]